MDANLNWIANFIWGIADDILRDLYVRGKYRDVILPMTVLRRLDALLEPSKQAVLDMKASLDKAGIVHQDQALRQAAGHSFLQHLQIHAPRSEGPCEPTAAQGRLRGIPRWLLSQRPGHSREVRVSESDPAAVQGRRSRHVDRETAIAGHQLEPEPAAERRWLGEAARPRHPRDGDDQTGSSFSPRRCARTSAQLFPEKNRTAPSLSNTSNPSHTTSSLSCGLSLCPNAVMTSRSTGSISDKCEDSQWAFSHGHVEVDVRARLPSGTVTSQVLKASVPERLTSLGSGSDATRDEGHDIIRQHAPRSGDPPRCV